MQTFDAVIARAREEVRQREAELLKAEERRRCAENVGVEAEYHHRMASALYIASRRLLAFFEGLDAGDPVIELMAKYYAEKEPNDETEVR